MGCDVFLSWWKGQMMWSLDQRLTFTQVLQPVVLHRWHLLLSVLAILLQHLQLLLCPGMVIQLQFSMKDTLHFLVSGSLHKSHSQLNCHITSICFQEVAWCLTMSWPISEDITTPCTDISYAQTMVYMFSHCPFTPLMQIPPGQYHAWWLRVM